jgi:hypothetical protein
MIVSSLLHGRLWQPYQRRCLRDDSRKLPACAGCAAPSWRAMLCPAFARARSALRALCVVCSAGRKARGDMLASSFLLVARPDTRYTPDSLALSLGAVPSFSTARGPRDCPFQRILFASVTGAMSATRDCPWGGWSVLRGPQSLRASVVALVWREAPLCISLLALAFQTVECTTHTKGYILRACRRKDSKKRAGGQRRSGREPRTAGSERLRYARTVA